ncbi:Tyrosinase, partial [Paramuricea clavata]
ITTTFIKILLHFPNHVGRPIVHTVSDSLSVDLSISFRVYIDFNHIFCHSIKLLYVIVRNINFNLSCFIYAKAEPCNGHATEICNTNVCSEQWIEKCTEPADCRKRQEFLSMSGNDKHRFINAFITVSTHSEWKHRFKALARIHFENFRGKTIHHRHEFLPWHRWYLLMLENLLRCYDCGVTLPYWDWSLEADTWEKSEIWTWIGGDGNCKILVKVVGNFVLPPPSIPRRGTMIKSCRPAASCRCLMKYYAQAQFAPERVNRNIVTLRRRMRRFQRLAPSLQIIKRGLSHCQSERIREMFTVTFMGIPEFCLHHGFIDKIWSDWQQRSELHKNAHFGSISTPMAATIYSPKDVNDLQNQPGGVRVCYINPSGLKGIVIHLTRSLSADKLRSIPAVTAASPPRQVWELFKTPSEERERVKLSKKENEPSRSATTLMLKDQQQCLYTDGK